MNLNNDMNTSILVIIPSAPDKRGKGDPHGDRRRSTLRKRINRVLAKCRKKIVLTRFASEKLIYGDAYIFNYDSFSCADPEAYIPTV
ncbi:MAG: hypothetical protein ABSE40_13550 [Candidatus Sulfotelmatobacter sp.]